MTGGKKSSKEKKRRRRSDSCDTGPQTERKRRSTELSSSTQEPETSVPCAIVKEEEEEEEEETEELTDIEEGGLDLNIPLQPISFYIADRMEMLQQCFRVLGDKKLKKMLPDMLKDLPLDEIKQLCLEQVEMESDECLLSILQGDHGVDSATEEETVGHVTQSRAGLSSQHDSMVDSSSSMRDNAGLEEADAKVGKGEDYDALSINADTYDSDIEGASCEDRVHETPVATVPKVPGQPDDLVMDIEKSVNEILGLAEPVAEVPSATVAVLPEDAQPSAQQLELLELEMRARAIKALMKAGDVKKS
ncbi:caspase activity and apoptosis inhibitor 1 [Pseudophryne corroboree]|uniref:caspase activity and apoptosis inhibitor 1 n=1 Tax=Pseudophryne corroboree TaxID=495146 RepID=UPI0030813891